jgi:hypothetical protein
MSQVPMLSDLRVAVMLATRARTGARMDGIVIKFIVNLSTKSQNPISEIKIQLSDYINKPLFVK